MTTTVRARWTLTGALALTLFAAVWAVLRIGLWPLPGLPNFVSRIGIWRDADLPSMLGHLRENLPYQLIYEALGSRGIWWYVAQWTVTFIVAVGLLAWWYADSAGPGRRLRGVRLALLSPVVAVFLGFVGGYDPITIIGAMGMLWAWKNNSRLWLVVAGAFLGFQHLVQAFPMVIAAALTVWAIAQVSPEFRARRSLAWAVPGLFIGKLATMVVLLFVTGSVGGTRVEFLSEQWVRPALVSAINFWPVFLLSMFAGAWIIVAMCIVNVPARSQIALGAAFLVTLGSCVIAADHTRIFVLIAVPSLALMTGWLLARADTTPRALVTIEIVAWVITPLLLWTGSDGVGYVQHLGAVDQLIMFGQTVSTWQ